MTSVSQAAIADSITTNLPKLIEDWCRSVRDDPRIESDANLSTPELIDHVPAIVEQICELIRKSETPNVRNSNEARANVYVRFQQGYKGRDLIRELSILRITLLDFLMKIAIIRPPGFGIEQSHDAATIINLYIDEEMRYVVSVYSSPPRNPPQEPIHKQEIE